MNNVIYFDMDNTLNKLKCVKDVWRRLDNKDVTPYMECLPCEHNIELLRCYKKHGYKVVILSCLSRVTDEQFDEATCKAKHDWLCKYVGMEYIDECMYIPYTKHKEDYVEEEGILVDDDISICMNWNKGNSIVAKI